MRQRAVHQRWWLKYRPRLSQRARSVAIAYCDGYIEAMDDTLTDMKDVVRHPELDPTLRKVWEQTVRSRDHAKATLEMLIKDREIDGGRERPD